jgi:cyclophilin family peptidyl-prolyl cis-trans isomerase
MKLLIALSLAVLLAGCSKPDETASGTGSSSETTGATTTSGTTGESSATTTTTGGDTSAKPTSTGADVQSREPKAGDEVAVIDTNKGRIVFMFFPDVAPKHVANFKALARKGFYDGTKFHRVIPTFMIQGGDPNSKDDDRSNDGMGGSGTNVDAEFSEIDHRRGIVSMARGGGDINSASSQFFIVVADSAFLNHQYSAFGKVVSGMEVADKIKDLPTEQPGVMDNPLPDNPAIMKSVKIEKWPVK